MGEDCVQGCIGVEEYCYAELLVVGVGGIVWRVDEVVEKQVDMPDGWSNSPQTHLINPHKSNKTNKQTKKSLKSKNRTWTSKRHKRYSLPIHPHHIDIFTSWTQIKALAVV